MAHTHSERHRTFNTKGNYSTLQQCHGVIEEVCHRLSLSPYPWSRHCNCAIGLPASDPPVLFAREHRASRNSSCRTCARTRGRTFDGFGHLYDQDYWHGPATRSSDFSCFISIFKYTVLEALR